MSTRPPSTAYRLPWTVVLHCLLAALVVAVPASAQFPDIRQMSGMPLPSGELPDGTVSVRVVRESLANNLTGVTVTVAGDGVAESAQTDAEGRAIFSGLRSGATVQARVTLDGETVSSQSFSVPAQGGVRLILAMGLTGAGGATDAPPGSGAPAAGSAPGVAPGSAPGSGPGAAPSVAVPGRVVLGTQTRTIVEVIDGALEVFHVFEIANVADGPVDVGAPIEFPLPDGARTVTLLEGSTPQARVFERKLVIAGPFAPGRTMAQVAYRLGYSGPTADVSITLPLPMIQTNLIVRKLGDMRVVAPVLAQSREAQAEGRTYWTGTGPGLNAGEVLTVSLDGLPYHSPWPRYTALALAGVVVLVGLWLGFASPVNAERRIAELEARRVALLDAVRALGADGPGDSTEVGAGTARQRAALLDELEGVYAMLDAERDRLVPSERTPASRPS